MTGADDVVRLIRETTPERAPEILPLASAAGRRLRTDIFAPDDLPRTDRATMDGYAIRADEPLRTLRIAGVARTDAGTPAGPDPGEAVRVSTGTALADHAPLRVVPIEETTVTGDRLTLPGRLPAKRFVHVRGADAKRGETLLKAGSSLTPGAVALLASLGLTHVPASPRLRIRHYTTGDEVVAPENPLPPGRVYDANGPMIGALLLACGESVARRHLREDFDAALATVRADLADGTTDLLLISGGAGPGTGDFTARLLEESGYTVRVRGGVAIRPGKPLVFGTNAHGVAFGLPGNPLSQWASFHTFVMPAIRALRGETGDAPRIRAVLDRRADDLADARPTLHPATVIFTGDRPRATLLPWSASGNTRVAATANAMILVPPGTPALDEGAEVDAVLL